MLNRFVKDPSGNFAMLMGLLAIPLCLAIGLSIDYTRYLTAKNHLQDVTDAAALAMAASVETDQEKLRTIGEQAIAANINNLRIKNVALKNVSFDNDQVSLDLGGDLPTTFMALGGFRTMPVETSALALRAVTGSVEVALVLDNTYSMSKTDDRGVSKLDTLKTAAKSLVEKLTNDPKAAVKIGVVPYADYVNVGTQYRNEPWLSVPADYQVDPAPRVCSQQQVTSTPCLENAPKYACVKYTDGVPYNTTCGGECTKKGDPVTTTKEVCTGGGKTTYYKWYGCVGSRMTGTTRLDDGSPSVTYPGYVETTQNCLSPLLPLTSDKSALISAINDMAYDGSKYGNSGYKPYTYIPAGLIWGQNLLSPTAPFTEGLAYDSTNEKPRKVVVLMTDGENSMNFRKSDGRHIQVAYPTNFDPTSAADVATRETKMKATNNDTKAICAYMKTNNIEIYTVAFMVDMPFAKAVLQDCATDADHYFDASDPQALLAAFGGIARSLTRVRLAR